MSLTYSLYMQVQELGIPGCVLHPAPRYHWENMLLFGIPPVGTGVQNQHPDKKAHRVLGLAVLDTMLLNLGSVQCGVSSTCVDSTPSKDMV